MKEVLLLTKILFKGSSTQLKNNDNKKSKGFGKIIFFLFVYLYIAGIIGYISYESIKSLMEIKQENIFLNICFKGMFGFSIIQSVVTSLNILFFSKDLEYLLPLPIKPQKIVMAKLNCLILSQYILCATILVPALIVYGVLLNLGPIFYIISLLVILLLPVIPVTITALLVTIIMRFTNVIKNKDFVQYITVILTIILVIAIQLLCGNMQEEMTDEEFANKLMQTNGVIEEYSIFFITLKPIMNSIINHNNIYGVANIIFLFAISFAFYFIISLIISKLYIKSVTSSISSGVKEKNKLSKENDFSKNNVMLTYVKKEFKILTRNPIFFMQCVLPSILFPFIISIPIFTSIKDVTVEEMIFLKEQLGILLNTQVGLAGILVVLIFLFTLNFASITSISRDGENAVFMKYIPVELDKQCLFKAIPGIILNIFPIIYAIIFGKILMPTIQIKTIMYIVILSMLINIFNNYLVILIDLKNPKLKWISEYTVVKQNFNMFFEFLLAMVEIAVIIFIGLRVSSIDILAVSIFALFGILILITKKYISKNKLKLFRKII